MRCVNKKCNNEIERKKYNLGFCNVCYEVYREGFRDGYYNRDDVLLDKGKEQ